ncbi:MAG: hypothetical protein WC358_06615 [Ignavibacteria bacterium]|jgi:hypothetical protein
MKKDYKTEELLENLPDYINNNIENNKLKEAIEKEILINPEFNKEFELIRVTLKSINRLEFSSPPDNYFNSLLPRVNERIYENSENLNILKRFASYWKYAIPIVTIILFFIGYKVIFKNNDYINRINNDSEFVLKEYNYSDYIYTDTSINFKEKTATEYSENKDSNLDNTYDLKKTYNNKKEPVKSRITNNEELINAFLDLSDNFAEEEIFFPDDDDMYYEQDLENFSNEEQNSLISTIKNSNL